MSGSGQDADNVRVSTVKTAFDCHTTRLSPYKQMARAQIESAARRPAYLPPFCGHALPPKFATVLAGAWMLPATVQLSLVLDGCFATIRSRQRATDDDWKTLALICTTNTVLDALDLVDKGEVACIHLPSGRYLYQVAAASSPSLAYTVHMPRSEAGAATDPAQYTAQLGYCPCPAFAHSVLRMDNAVICKHLLAAHLARALDHCTTKTDLGLKWVAAWSDNFRRVVTATDNSTSV
ncbi:hypothetical protein OIV83_001273 [Microbotryomycetes sp. JL201]|nr:hypothetical protein OIV83_001273 [Microbotryomycetes sp. JL201]